jgi:hypothetical protein
MSTSISAAEPTGSIAVRALCLAGALLTASLLYLGGIWPSFFTLAAIAALPAPILFLVALARPPLVRNHRFLRYYLVGCSVAAGLAWAVEIWWLSHVN